MKVSVQYAETHLSDLISAADNGEEVEITRTEKPALKLLVSAPSTPVEQTGRRVLGAGQGQLRIPSFEEWQTIDADFTSESDTTLMTTGNV